MNNLDLMNLSPEGRFLLLLLKYKTQEGREDENIIFKLLIQIHIRVSACVMLDDHPNIPFTSPFHFHLQTLFLIVLV